MNGLIPTQREQLDELERVIERGLDSFIEVGTALASVRDRKLYKDEHGTFEAYCEQRWSLSRKRAYDLMDAADTVAALSPIGDTPLPANEGQARELAGLDTQVAATVMRAADDATEGKKITAGAIREAREQIAPRAKVTETTKTEYDVDTSTGEVVDPPDDTAALVAEFVNSGGEYQLAVWRQNFMKAIARAGQLRGFTPDVVAEKADALLLDEVARLVAEFTEYGDQIRRATRGLRTIQGGRS